MVTVNFLDKFKGPSLYGYCDTRAHTDKLATDAEQKFVWTL